MKSFKVTNFSQAALWTGLLILTLVSRFAFLTNKPIHFDESINGWFVMQMQKMGYYKYDPNNYHGPLYFYLLQGFEFLWGRSLETLRSVPAFFGVLSVMVFSFGALQAKFVNRSLSVFMLLSPAFLFFGRSGIHEMPFVFFQIVMALSFLRWMERPDGRALGLFLVGLFGIVTLKETFVVTLFCWVVAFISLGTSSLQTVFGFERFKKAWSGRLTLLSVVLFLLFVQLYTGFFKNMQGLADFFRAVLPWLKTGVQGHGHEKSFFYWLQVLYAAEPLVLLGIVLAVVGLFSKRKDLRLVSVFSLTQLLVYSLIPYKTVWCILTLVWGFYFVLAFSLRSVWEERPRYRPTVLLLLAVLFGFGIRSAYVSVYQRPLDLSHPYVYVNSTYELRQVSDIVTATLQSRPNLLTKTIQVGMKEQWPWPWLLRRSQGLSYELCSKRILADALIYLCDPNVDEPLERLLNAPYWKLEIVLRQSREASLIYLKKSEFDMSEYKGSLQVVGPAEEDAP